MLVRKSGVFYWGSMVA